MRTAVIVSAALLALSFAPANSQTRIGSGSQSCQKWIDLHSVSPSAETTALDSWALGYLEGRATLLDSEAQLKGLPPMNILQGLDVPTVIKLTGEYCRGNPLPTIGEAVDQLSAQMVADKGIHIRSSELKGIRKIQVVTNRPQVETTGSGEITGSISNTHRCETISVTDPTNAIIRNFRKCE